MANPNFQQHPPPPPMHRYPSWEHRIYQVASEGIQEQDSSKFDSKNNNGESGFGSDINVPVYATVKGVSHFWPFWYKAVKFS